MSSDTDNSELPLGTAPLPRDAAALAARIADTVRGIIPGAAWGPGFPVIDAADGAVVDADAVVVRAIRVDLGAPAVSIQADENPADVETRVAPVASTEPWRIDEFTLTGAPRVALVGTTAELAARVDAQLRHVHLDVLADTNGQAWALAVTSRSPLIAGDLAVEVPTADLTRMVDAALQLTLKEMGLTLTSLDLSLTADTPRSLRVEAKAAVRKGILSGSVTARALADIDDEMVVTVREADLSSGNVLVKALLAAARPYLDRVVGQRHPIAPELPAGVRLSDVAVSTGDTVRITAVIGS